MARNYSSVVEPKRLTTDITDAAATQITLNNVTGLPAKPYVLVINPDTEKEEVVLVTVDQTGVTSPTLKVQRAIENSGGVGVARSDHTVGDVVKHMIVGSDLQIVHDHTDNTTTAHGINNKAPLASPTFTGTVVLPSTTSIGSVSATEIGYLDGVTSPIQTQFSALDVFPKGMITPFAGTNAPTGWLLCDGTAKSRTTYAALWDVLRNGTSSSPYGNGDGSTTFNLPDLLGRSPIGAGAGAGLTARTLADKPGVESVALSVNEMPSHNHPFDASDGLGSTNRTHYMDRNASHGHGMDGVGDHTHSITSKWSGAGTHDHAGPGSIGSVSSGSDQSGGTETQTSTNGAGGHAHGIHGADINHRHTIQAQGGGAAHTNIQPSTVVNFIIKH